MASELETPEQFIARQKDGDDKHEKAKRSAPLSSVDRWIMVWLVVDAMTHLILESAFCILSLQGPIIESKSAWAVPWKEYSKADRRWGTADATILAMELFTAWVDGPMCLLLMYAIVKRAPWRHPLQLVLCAFELYGGWMTFAPEWVSGSKNLETSNPMNLIVYLAFANGVWVIIPLLLAVQSWYKLVHAARESHIDQPAADRVAPMPTWVIVTLVSTVALYVIMIVYVLCFYMDRNQ